MKGRRIINLILCSTCKIIQNQNTYILFGLTSSGLFGVYGFEVLGERITQILSSPCKISHYNSRGKVCSLLRKSELQLKNTPKSLQGPLLEKNKACPQHHIGLEFLQMMQKLELGRSVLKILGGFHTSFRLVQPVVWCKVTCCTYYKILQLTSKVPRKLCYIHNGLFCSRNKLSASRILTKFLSEFLRKTDGFLKETSK